MASRSTCEANSALGKLITHCCVRRRFSAVCDVWPKPSMQVQPSHHADDMGAMFALPSAFEVLMRATGVPKYRMVGSMVRCRFVMP